MKQEIVIAKCNLSDSMKECQFYNDIVKVRDTVFLHEKKWHFDAVYDHHDFENQTKQFVCYYNNLQNHSLTAVGIGRNEIHWNENDELCALLSKIAVIKEYRNSAMPPIKDVAKTIITVMENDIIALPNQPKKIQISAVKEAISFYERLNYATNGEERTNPIDPKITGFRMEKVTPEQIQTVECQVISLDDCLDFDCHSLIFNQLQTTFLNSNSQPRQINSKTFTSYLVQN